MSEQPPSPETLLAVSLEITSSAERRAYLDRACAGNETLRQEVESLLAAHEQAGAFMSSEAVKATLPLPPTEKAGHRIGRYKLLEQIGEGGFGVVWMAEQEEPVRRRVALKIIKLGMDTREVVARFEAERQALAMMDHPNIAIVFDGGATDTGRPYFVMELVRGVRITDYCEANKLSIPERLELFMQVCAAVQHAHQKGIIHRDLKPSNVLVSVQDDRPVPKVIDFGIAKATAQRLTDKTVFTRFQQVIGTPAYMSPEQAGANREDIDTRSDIYSLGVLLYELLTGKTPFETSKLREAGMEAILKTIREEEPPKPSARLTTLTKEELTTAATQRRITPEKLGKLVRGELDWIVMKALEKDRTRRYESASVFAEDLRRHLRQEPVVAAPPSTAYRLRRFARRNRVALATATAFGLVLVGGIVTSTSQAWRANRFAREADGQRQLATNEAARALRFADESERARNQAEAGAYSSRVLLAAQRLEAGDLTQADRLLEACPPPLRQWEWHYLKRQCQPACQVLVGQSNEVCRLAASTDGRWLASLEKDGRLLLWNLQGDLSQPAQTWPATVGTERFEDKLMVEEALAFSHDAHRLAYVRPVGKDEWALGVVSLGGLIPERELLRASGEKLKPLCLSFSPDDQQIIVANADGMIRSYDAANGREVASYPILAAAFSPDGSRVVSLGMPVGLSSFGERRMATRDLRVFDTSTGRELLAITNLHETGELLSVAVSPDGARVAAGFVEMAVEKQDRGAIAVWAELGRVIVWDVSARKEMLRHRLMKNGPMALEFSLDSQRLAIACARLEFIGIEFPVPEAGGAMHLADTGRILIINVRSGEEVRSLCGHLHDVNSLAFIPGSNRLVSGSSDHTIRVWELGASTVIPLGGHGSVSWRNSASLSLDGRMVAVPTLEGALDVVDLVTGRTLASARPFEGHNSHDAVLATSPAALVWLSDSALRFWDLPSGREAWSYSLTNLGFEPEKISCSPDGRRVALAPEPQPPARGQGLSDLVLLEAGTGKLILRTNLPGVCSFAFSPDNRFLVAGDYDGNVRVWNTTSGDAVFCRRVTEPRPGASLRDVFSKQVSSEWRDLPVMIPVSAVAASPDGSLLATAAGCLSAELRLWDMVTGQPKWVASLATGASALAFSPDRLRLAVACGWLPGSGGRIGIFDVTSGQELLHIDAKVDSLAFSPDGMRLWGVTPKRTLVFWEAPPWPGPATPPAVAFKPSVVESLDQRDARLAMKTALHEINPTFNGRLVFMPGSSRLAVTSDHGSVRLLRVPGGELETKLTGAEGEITGLAVSADGKKLFAGTDQGFVFVWTDQKNPAVKVPAAKSGPVTGLAVSPDGSQAIWDAGAASARSGENLAAVEVATGRRLWSSPVQGQDSQVVSFSGDGKSVAVVQSKVMLLEAKTGRKLHELTHQDLPGESTPISTALSRDGRLCAAGYSGNKIGIWGISEGKWLRWFEAHQHLVVSLAFSPDGARLASGSIDRTASVWQVATGKEIGRVRFAEPWAVRVSISDDGRWLAAGRPGEFRVVEFPLCSQS